MLDLAFENRLEFEHLYRVIFNALSIENCKSLSNNGGGDTLSLCNRVDVLDFDESFQVLFEQLSEVVLQLATSKKLKDSLPVWRVCEFSQIWSQVITKNSECSRLSNTVGSD